MFGNKGRGRLASVLLAAVLATGVVACGGEEEPSSSGGGDSGEQASSGKAAFDAKVDKLVEEGMAEQTRKPPAEGPKTEAGKHVVVISCDQRAEGCRRNVEGTLEAAKVAGWRTTLVNGAGDPTKFANGVRRAIDVKADGIVMIAIDSAFIPDVLKQAKEAGIAITCWVCGNEPPLYDDVITAPDSYDEDGYLAAAAAYKMQDRKLHMLMMEEKDFYVVKQRGVGTRRFVKECADVGGDCKILGSAEHGLTDITTSAPQKAVNLARTNPTANVFWVSYDAAATFQFQALKQANLQGDMIGIGFDANSANLDDIRADGFQKITIGQPATWDGFGFLDNINRVIQDEEVVDQGVRTKLLTKENAPPEGAWDGDADVEPAYREIWGK